MTAAAQLAPDQAEDSANESARHRWTSPLPVAQELCINGCEQQQRTCRRCGLIMITMIPPFGALPWHEYRHPSGAWQRALERRPPCPGVMMGAA